ncbi:SpaA isopeptide-forming pilin-related protein [Carnobacterium maltaromaticum]|uniref:SpaA isopeptide-forming pilin-related protein n=1 Tax=Carnobacterium maltaromaticum TaxID=2751 RepID=A0AAW9JVW2_CARML|nr:SpaA isopeptide-forming pilin-related protein [Carnobacterium maltaromaticum]MDZ5760657.1 SpaA isopeptide-forming pilin-related protein [Carnobacterium maltaromaticum]
MQKFNVKSIITRLAVLLIMGQTFISPISVFADVISQSETTEKIKEEQTQEAIENTEKENNEDDIKPPEKEQAEEVQINENARSKASPVIEEVEKIQEDAAIQKEPSIDELGSLSVGEDGKIYYKGEPLYVGANGEEIPADLNELMKQGVPQTLMMRAGRATGATIQYNGQVSYGGTTVGDFSVNGKQAFCLQHPKPTPPSGTQGSMNPYDNDNIKRIMYYGWTGPANIFGGERDRGIVVTSVVLSKYYNGDVSGTSIPGWAELDNLAQNGALPKHGISLEGANALVNLKVSLVNGKQVSESKTLIADESNYINPAIPAGITLVNETTGSRTTNGTATIYGNQRFHLEADVRYTGNFNSGVKAGVMKAFQPLVIRPADSGLQDIGTWQWYDDPAQVVSFKADFFARLGDVHLIKEDRETVTAQGDATLDGAVYRITDSVGTSRDVTIQNGKATAKNLLIGEITYQEIKAPIGYLLDPTVYRATLDYNSQTGKIEIIRTVKEDVIKGNVDIMKYYSLVEGSAILIPEKGAGFSIYLESNGNLVQTQETNALGHARFNNLPFGSYLVKQTKSPAGTLPVADFKVKVDEHGQTYFYNILNGKFKSPTKLIKVDSETGKNVLVPGTVFKIKDLETGLWVNQTTHNITEFVTDENGEVLLYDELRFGDYELHEIKAPAGYVLNKTPHKFSVNQESQENGMIVVKFANKAQKGKVILNKTGEVATGSKIKDTEYGKQYEFEYSQKPLAGSEFNVIATKDIITGDGTMYHQKGDIAGTATTDENGKLTIGDLHLGSYALVETKAPKGYVLDGKEYPFELTYAGQEVEVTTAEVSVKNVLQDLVIKINKTEESAKWEDGKVVIEEVPSNGKVFGVYSDQDFSYNKNVIVPANSLVGVATTKEGIAGIQQKYPEGKFFVKELDAGNDHVINPNEFKFEFTAQDNNKTLEIGIWGDSVAYGKQNLLKIARNPITNELGKINVKLIKVDDEVSLTEDTPLAGVEYDLILKKDGNKEIVGHYVTDGNGEINVENIPSGDYEFVETKALTDYILDTKPIEFESTPETNGDSIEFRVVNKHMPPTLGTYASGINGQKLFNPRIENVIYDDMDYEFVYAGIDIFLTTILMEKGATPAQDKEVQRKETTIKSTGTKFTTQVGLTIPANTMDGNKDYYFVEIAHRDEERKIEYVKHDDRDDKGQTIRSEVPKIETLFAGLKGEKDFNPKKDNSMVDKVNATNFETNHEFTIVTEYVNPKTLEVVAVDEQQKIFSEQDSIFDVFLNLAANKMKSGDKLVATHRVYYDKEKTILYAEHYDLGNLKQTISFTAPKVVVLPQTGENAGTLAIMGVLIIGLVAVGFAVRSNRLKKEKNKLMEKVALYGFGGEQSIFSEDEDQVECEVATLLVEGIIETGSKIGLENEKAKRLLEKVELAYLVSTTENTVLEPIKQL